ncbi:unnamed protein product [Callosobruchus maculatus]|nr:unnamed protein product [Callosobruchus maculatus]
MASHKNTWTTPLVPFLTTKRTVDTYLEETSTELSEAFFDQPDEEKDELYSPTLWSFGTFMSRNHSSVTKHPPSRPYVSQYMTGYANQHNPVESEASLGKHHTPGTNLAATKSPDFNLLKESVSEVVRSESEGFLTETYTHGPEAPVIETYTSKQEEQSLIKLQEAPANQLISSKPDSSFVKHFTSVTNPAIITTTTPAALLNLNSTSSEYHKQFINYLSPIESDSYIGNDHKLEENVPESLAQKEILHQPGSSQKGRYTGEYYARVTKVPTLTASTSKFQSKLYEQSNRPEYVTHAEEAKTFGRNQAVSKSTTSISHTESATQFNSKSKYFIVDGNESASPIPETSTKSMKHLYPTESDAYAETHHIPDRHETKAPLTIYDFTGKNKEVPKKMATTIYTTSHRTSTDTTTLLYQTKPIDKVHQTEPNVYANTLGSSETLSKYSISKPLKEPLNQLINSKSNNSYDVEGSSRKSVTKIPDLLLGRDHVLEINEPSLESSTVTHKNEIKNQFNTTETYSSITYEANSSASKPLTFNPRKDFVDQTSLSKPDNLIGKKYMPVKAFSTPRTVTSNRRTTKHPVANIVLSTQKGFVSYTDYMHHNNDTNVLRDAISESTTAAVDMPTKLSVRYQNIGTLLTKNSILESMADARQPSRYESGKIEIDNQEPKNNLGPFLANNFISPSLSISAQQQPAYVNQLHLFEGGEKQGESKNRTTSPGSSVFMIKKTGNLFPLSRLQPMDQLGQIETVRQGSLPEAEEYQTEFKNDGNLFGNWVATQAATTSQPNLESSAVDSITEFDNQLYYSGTKNEDTRTNGDTFKYGSGAMHFENQVTDSYYRSTEAPVVRTAQSQLYDTGHIMTIYKQPIDRSDIQHQGEYRIYDTATTTALPYYESTDSNTRSALWHSAQGESYPVQQQTFSAHTISNGGISWLVPQTPKNAPASGYSWWPSGKPSNFDTREGSFEVSSARNEIKLIYRPNVPAEVVSRSGSTHYETVDNPDGGKTHKLVLYV